jgi:uncharacterized membrane protein
MIGDLLLVYVHIMAAVLWTGYLLFWAIIAKPVAQELGPSESTRLFRRLRDTPWPPPQIPVPVRLRFSGVGWALLVVFLVTGLLTAHDKGATLQRILSGQLFQETFGILLAVKLLLFAGLVILQLLSHHAPTPRLFYLNMAAGVSVVALSIVLARWETMDIYLMAVFLHVAAAFFWLGHMFFWSLVAGFVTKSIEPRETGDFVRRASLRMGGLGWPALLVLLVTGIVIIIHSKITLHHIVSGDFLFDPMGRVMAVKMFLVGCMALYQWFVGHRHAPRLIYLNMLVALVIIALSVLRVRSPWE